MSRNPPSQTILDIFHGKPPSIFWKMYNGRLSAWGRAARVPRQQVLDTLARVGLTMVLATKGLPMGKGRGFYAYQVGEITSF